MKKIVGRHIATYALALIATLYSGFAVSESIHENWQKLQEKGDKTPTINFQLSAPHSAATYSCNLAAVANLCREYRIHPFTEEQKVCHLSLLLFSSDLQPTL